jgi:hypothetical protein
MATDPGYYALIYQTTTGQVVSAPLPDANQTEPTWLQQINNTGVISWRTIVDGTVLTKEQLVTYRQGEWRFGLAICYGTGGANDFICQAGPITASVDVSESPPIVQFGAVGFWGLLDACYQVNPTWNGASIVTAGGGADTTYTSSLQGIASLMLTDAITPCAAIGRGTLPLDVPAPIAGANVRNYFGYEFASTGQRLAELTQVQNGPDVFFAPYFSAPQVIRHHAVIGNPTITQPGNPLVFNYPGSVRSILTSRDASRLATWQVAVGTGQQDQVMWSQAQDATLISAGWPSLFAADTSHTDVTDQATLDSWAQGDLGINNRPVETWAAVVRMSTDPLFGTFMPGVQASYWVQGHPTKRNGQYVQRMIGFGSGSVSSGGAASVTPGVGEYLQILQSTAGQI